MIFRTINEYLYHVSGFLYYFSATVNPILYNLMSLKYRHAFRQTLCGGGMMGRGRNGGTERSRRQGTQRSYTFRSTARTGRALTEMSIKCRERRKCPKRLVIGCVKCA